MTRWLAPAKLNLFLHINGRRSDGYHELQTLFQFIDFADELTFEVTADGVIELIDALSGVASEQNLITRAARLLQQHSGCKSGARIELDKKLPMGAGLGGGSSDAATTLVVLNRLWQLGYAKEQLATLGRQLGADVPVFIHGHATLAQGVGDIFHPAAPQECWYLLLIPQVEVSTAAVFGDPALTRDTPKYTPDQLTQIKTRNDCQPIVVKHYPEVAQALGWLIEYAPARMTGTGSCVFAPFASEEQAKEVQKQCPAQFTAVVCRGQNQSPLYRQLQRTGS